MQPFHDEINMQTHRSSITYLNMCWISPYIPFLLQIEQAPLGSLVTRFLTAIQERGLRPWAKSKDMQEELMEEEGNWKKIRVRERERELRGIRSDNGEGFWGFKWVGLVGHGSDSCQLKGFDRPTLLLSRPSKPEWLGFGSNKVRFGSKMPPIGSINWVMGIHIRAKIAFGLLHSKTL